MFCYFVKKGANAMQICLEVGTGLGSSRAWLSWGGEAGALQSRAEGDFHCPSTPILLYFLSLECCECIAYSKCIISCPEVNTNVM